MISLTFDETIITDCVSVIVVPEIAVTEPGHIKTLTSNAAANAKHEFHALAQMVYYRYQDDELDIGTIHGLCRINCSSNMEELTSGVIIYRNTAGEIGVLAHEELSQKKLLEAVNRFCTRWVRLDI